MQGVSKLSLILAVSLLFFIDNNKLKSLDSLEILVLFFTFNNLFSLTTITESHMLKQSEWQDQLYYYMKCDLNIT